ncbi:conserved hypothetical protein [Arthrobacter sp. Hiyo8]|nr:conserved hypothetical protein [Arthrobacter sp. Hiyo8]
MLASHDFPSRALYGRYLRSTLEELLDRVPAGVEIAFHRSNAVAAHPLPGGPTDGSPGKPAGGGFDVELDDGARLTVDSLVLALGHLESRLNPEQRSFREVAAELGLLYVPPAAPADVDWALVPAGETVLVRGMGLNFFDVMGQLTEGRGGQFVPAEGGLHGKLKYLPSGQEPKIIAASRRGTPYRAKAGLDGYYPSPCACGI